MSAAVELLLTYRFVAGVDRGSGGPKPYPLAGPVYPGDGVEGHSWCQPRSVIRQRSCPLVSDRQFFLVLARYRQPGLLP